METLHRWNTPFCRVYARLQSSNLPSKQLRVKKKFHAQLNDEAGEGVKSKSFKTVRLAISRMVRIDEGEQDQPPSVKGVAAEIAAT